MLAVVKPAGLLTQAPPGIDSLEQRLRRDLQTRSQYVALPHRLDRPVGGVILVALTKKAARLLSEQFAARKVVKTYTAVVFVPTGFQLNSQLGHWTDWLAKVDRRAEAIVTAEGAPAAKLAETDAELISEDVQNNSAVLKLTPRTGRMHQLRIQAAERGLPIFGDQTYGCTASPSACIKVFRGGAAQSPAADRIALAATEITFFEPTGGRRTTVTCPADGLHFNV